MGQGMFKNGPSKIWESQPFKKSKKQIYFGLNTLAQVRVANDAVQIEFSNVKTEQIYVDLMHTSTHTSDARWDILLVDIFMSIRFHFFITYI